MIILYHTYIMVYNMCMECTSGPYITQYHIVKCHIPLNCTLHTRSYIACRDIQPCFPPTGTSTPLFYTYYIVCIISYYTSYNIQDRILPAATHSCLARVLHTLYCTYYTILNNIVYHMLHAIYCITGRHIILLLILLYNITYHT